MEGDAYHSMRNSAFYCSRSLLNIGGEVLSSWSIVSRKRYGFMRVLKPRHTSFQIGGFMGHA
jgi:hypothetical protein